MGLPILVVGGGIAGLSSAIALRRLGYDVVVYEKARELRDAGSGMSVIGHSLVLLEALGVNVRDFGLPQADVSLRKHTGEGMFSVPLSDAQLTPQFGTVQYNLHRGKLHQALLKVYLADGGYIATSKPLAKYTQDATSVTATFADGEVVRARVLIGADGIHSKARACSGKFGPVRYSGYTCWRGLFQDEDGTNLDTGMYKTITSPAGRQVSFTQGVAETAPNNRLLRFWALDSVVPARTLVPPTELKAHLLDRLRGYPAYMRRVVAETTHENIVQTDVYDAPVWPPTYRDGRVVLVGDAAHPVVHHFGQGACMAIEDAVRLARSFQRSGVPTDVGAGAESSAQDVVALREFDSFFHWLRCALLVYLSRWCGDLYTTAAPWAPYLLALCLTWPLSLGFTVVISLLLFQWGYSLRAFASSALTRKSAK